MAALERETARLPRGPERYRRLAAVVVLLMVAAACSGPREHRNAAESPERFAAAIRVVDAPEPFECVPYARRLSRIDLRGDAWTWWSSADGVFDRGPIPRPGAVLVLRRQGGSRGHLAVVTGIVSDRVVLVSHANWLNKGRIYENAPVRDVSENGDWSAVRVWYPPGDNWGKRVYAAYGFIYRDRQVASLDRPASVSPTGTWPETAERPQPQIR